MPLPSLVLLTVLLATSLALGAEPLPLAKAAQAAAVKLPAGSIVTGERIGEAVAFGAAGHLEPQDTPPEKVLFEIGSISKVFTALLLAQTVLEGKVKLESTLKQVMGNKQSFADPKVAAITLLQLATHTSGLPRVPEGRYELDPGNDPYAGFDREKLSLYLAAFKMEGQPPFDQAYSNLGFGILGEVLSRLYGKPWAELVHDRITQPLGMKDTTVRLSEDQARRFAPAYSKGEHVKAWTFAAMAGAGALRSTAADMITFGDALLAPEKTPLKEAVQLMLQPHSGDGSMGLAIFIGKTDGETVYEHSGGTGGYRSLLQVMPASHRVRVVLINNSAMDPAEVLQLAHPQPHPTFKEGKPLSDAQLSELTGIYKLGANALFTALLQNHHLQVRLTGQGFMPLFPEDTPDRFFYKTVPAEILFTREGGQVTGLTLFQNGREPKAKKTPEPGPAYHLQAAPQLKPYEGHFQLAPEVAITMEVRGNTLFTQLTGQQPLAVYETAHDHFEVADVKAALQFDRDANNSIIAVTLLQDGHETRALKQK